MELLNNMWFNTQFTLEKIPHVFRLKFLNKKIITPSIQIDFQNDYYHVKTANTAEEMAQVLSLRFDIFFREFSTRKISFSLFPYDVDMHDFNCDHLIVKDKSSDQVVACYRLQTNSSEKNIKSFYTEGEFDISSFLRKEGIKLEIGRACVHKEYRKGTVISLLWRGLLDYAKKSHAKYMFGCSSLNRADFNELPHLMNWLTKHNALIQEFDIKVQPKYQLPKNLLPHIDISPENASKPSNSLILMYVLAGAKLSRTLAYDAEMDCLDLLTIIDLDKLPSSFARKFGA